MNEGRNLKFKVTWMINWCFDYSYLHSTHLLFSSPSPHYSISNQHPLSNWYMSHNTGATPSNYYFLIIIQYVAIGGINSDKVITDSSNLLCLSIQGEVGNSSLITSVSIKCFGAVFDSREERFAACFFLCVWDHCSLTSTHNQHFVAISKKTKRKISFCLKMILVEHALIKIICNTIWCNMLKHCITKHLTSGFVSLLGAEITFLLNILRF